MIAYVLSVVWLVLGLALSGASLLLNQKIVGATRLILGLFAGLLFITSALPIAVLFLHDPLCAVVAAVPITLVTILPLRFFE